MSRGRDNEQDRSQRVPLGVPRLKLSTDQRPGYVRRWINDVPGRLQAAEQGGYTFVFKAKVGDVPGDITDKAGMDSRVSRIVGTSENGGPITAYLMEIKEDWYDEDQGRKQAGIKRTEDALKRGADDHGEPGSDQRYVPKEGIKIKQV